jgi:TrmH family RNA methyltransferase
MISKNKLKYYSSLLHKKYRDSEGKFLAEGKKIIEEAMESGINAEVIFFTAEFARHEEDFISGCRKLQIRLEELKATELKRLTDTVTPQGIVGVFDKPKHNLIENLNLKSKLIVLLDNITEPGNLGAIIRNCDWFGINEILISQNSADIYNPKTIRASMGSIFHLKIFDELVTGVVLSKLRSKNYKILCADLTGENIFEMKLPDKAVIIFSSEAHGPSSVVLGNTDLRITIPRFGNAESLNVAAATAVILAEIKRRI